MSENKWLVNVWVIHVIRLAILAVGWSSIVINLISTADLEVFFSYYTHQSNLIVLVWVSIAIIFQELKPDQKFFSGIVRGAITLYIFITFLVFVTLLETGTSTGIYAYTNFGLHYYLPLAMLVDWILTESHREYKWKYCIIWFVYPLFYVSYVTIRGLLTGSYPYLFLDLDALGPEGFAMWVGILAGLFVALGALFVLLNKLLNKAVK